MGAKARRGAAAVALAVFAAGYWLTGMGASATPPKQEPRAAAAPAFRGAARSAVPSTDETLAGFDPREREARLDGVGEGLPMLKGQKPEQQLQTLRWAQHVTGAKVVSLFPDLRVDGTKSYEERESIARGRIRAEIHKLEREGASAPDYGPDFKVTGTVGDLEPELLAALREGTAPPDARGVASETK